MLEGVGAAVVSPAVSLAKTMFSEFDLMNLAPGECVELVA